MQTVLLGWLVATMALSPPPARVSGQVNLGKRGAAREAVIYLECDKIAQPLSHAVVDQRDKTFIPHVSVVTTGTNVRFPNNDAVFHNVFAYYNAKKFDLGMYPQGKTKEVRFDKPGIVALLCNVHSEMSAYIMVVSTPYYAITDKNGRFEMRDVPPGSYTLRAWHESGATTTMPIQVRAEDSSLAVILTHK